ncbi:MAG: HAMP domain-containing protein [Candidatus Bathyarchaeia archaeon]|jgi:nitrogen fixation/metabolism regulation signal transduction histidine kinase
MKIKQKLLLSYLIIIALFIAAGATITYNAIRMNQLQNNVKQQETINDNAYNYQQGLDRKQFGTLMYSADQEQEGSNIVVASADEETQAQDYLATALTSNSSLLAQFDGVLAIDTNTINPAISQIVTLYNGDLNSSAKYVQIWDQMTSVMNATATADTQLAAIRSDTQTNVQNAVNTSQNYTNFSIAVAVIFIGAITATSVALSIVMGNRITNPLKNLANIAQKVSQGDLDQRYYLKQNADPKTGDEIDELVDAFKKMINAYRMQEALLKEDEGKD